MKVRVRVRVRVGRIFGERVPRQDSNPGASDSGQTPGSLVVRVRGRGRGGAGIGVGAGIKVGLGLGIGVGLGIAIGLGLGLGLGCVYSVHPLAYSQGQSTARPLQHRTGLRRPRLRDRHRYWYWIRFRHRPVQALQIIHLRMARSEVES